METPPASEKTTDAWIGTSLLDRASRPSGAWARRRMRNCPHRIYFMTLRRASMMDWLSAGRSDEAMKLYVCPEFKMT